MAVDTKTELHIKLSDDKSVQKKAIVREAFKNKYINVELQDQGVDHIFELKWDGFQYSGKFLDFPMTCNYHIEKDFTSTKDTRQKAEKFVKRKSGYPKH